MCPFEILHFAPLALIAGSVLLFKAPNKKLLSLTVAVLSVIGLIAGEHMHTEHAMPISMIDPCVGYFVSLAVSAFVAVKEFKLIKALAK